MMHPSHHHLKKRRKDKKEENDSALIHSQQVEAKKKKEERGVGSSSVSLSFVEYVFEPVPAFSLAVFRIIWGVIMLGTHIYNIISSHSVSFSIFIS